MHNLLSDRIERLTLEIVQALEVCTVAGNSPGADVDRYHAVFPCAETFDAFKTEAAR